VYNERTLTTDLLEREEPRAVHARV